MKIYFPGIDEEMEVSHLTLGEVHRSLLPNQTLRYCSKLRALIVQTWRR